MKILLFRIMIRLNVILIAHNLHMLRVAPKWYYDLEWYGFIKPFTEWWRRLAYKYLQLVTRNDWQTWSVNMCWALRQKG